MFCTNCGTEAPAHANFCPACGSSMASSGGDNTGTTMGILPGMESEEGLRDLPRLAPGTGMLVVVRGPSAGARFLLDRPLVTIGRNSEADLLLDDVTVSRHHAEIRMEDATATLLDKGSFNGSYVNGTQVEEQVLRTGDELQIGRFRLVYVGSDAV